MNAFWKTILTTVVTLAAIVSARYSAAWVANHTFRAERFERASAPPTPVRPAYVPPAPGSNYPARTTTQHKPYSGPPRS